MSDLVKEFREVGGNLRMLARLGSASWDLEYIREDLEGEYTESDLQEGYRNLMANQISSEELEKIGESGDLLAQQYHFEERIVFQIPASRYQGLFVSYDRTENFPVGDVLSKANQVSEFF